MKYYTEGIKNRIAPFRDVPIVFISALEKTRIFQAVEAALQVMENKKTKVATSVLNETLLPIIEATPPPTVRQLCEDQVYHPASQHDPVFCVLYELSERYQGLLQTVPGKQASKHSRSPGCLSIFSSARSNSRGAVAVLQRAFLLMAITWNQPQTAN